MHLGRNPEVRKVSALKGSQAYRARKAGATTEDFDSREIFERDHWRCGICGEHIDRHTRYPHPRSASLDHIVPLSKGGEHTRANAQAAHLGCNSLKNNRAVNDQLRLIG